MTCITGIRRKLRLLFFIYFCLFLPVLATAQELPILRISIDDQAPVFQQSFLLSDIAKMDGPRSAVHMAGKIRFPNNGVLYRTDVVNALKKCGVSDIRIELQMPEEVLLRRGQNAKNKNTVNLADLIKRIANWQWDVEVQALGNVPSGRIVGPSSIIPGTASTTLKFRDELGQDKSLPVRLAWYQPVVVLARSLNRGELITPDDVGVRSIRITRPDVYASSVEDVVGKCLRKAQPQGEPILLSLVEFADVIQRGTIVTLYVLMKGGLLVESKGEALQDGRMGESIRVKNLASKKTVIGIVRSPTRVEVVAN